MASGGGWWAVTSGGSGRRWWKMMTSGVVPSPIIANSISTSNASDCHRRPNHESHPNHSFTLLCSPSYKQDNVFTCNACLSNGSTFSYHCLACNFDLHVDWAFLPEIARNGNHNHPLTLFYLFPYNKTAYKEALIEMQRLELQLTLNAINNAAVNIKTRTLL
ncbi:hypothetical protein HYC85_010550 [Camellia sinensis]|uniref:DC1 domain-containing protein n=1 Tax=Camellia sinensis TaxID=4442 RepID=A0A7J7HKY1_CAMSI|nr:hypothetical protein HYC85_010550 [Camellia sinensis]